MHRFLPLAALVGLALTTGCGDKEGSEDASTGSTGTTDSGDALDDGADADTGADAGDDAGGEAGGEATGDAGSGGDGDDGGSGGDGTMDDGGSGDEGGEATGDDGGSTGDEGGGEDDGGETGTDSSGGSSGSGSSGSGSSGSGSGGSGSSGSGSSGSGSGGSGSSGSGSGGSGSTGGSTGSSTTDTDGDGQLDTDEVAAGTDPNDYYDRSYTGGYNVASCGTALPTASTPSGTYNGSATTYAIGDVVANFQMTDHNGDLVDLYSFCDNHVMLVFSAMWCGSCASVANQAQGKQNSYSSLGFQYLEVLVEDRTGSSVDSSELNQWASSYSLSTVPVLDDSTKAELIYYEQNWGYPTIVHLEAGTMSVLSLDSGQTNPAGWL